MTKEITVHDSDHVSHLAEEILAIVAVAHEKATMGMVAAKHMVGEAIATCAVYRKHAKGQGELYRELAKQTRMREETLADCVKLYEAYPKSKPKQLAEKLYLKYGAWRNVRASLYGLPNDRSDHEHVFKLDKRFVVEVCECGSRRIKLHE